MASSDNAVTVAEALTVVSVPKVAAAVAASVTAVLPAPRSTSCSMLLRPVNAASAMAPAKLSRTASLPAPPSARRPGVVSRARVEKTKVSLPAPPIIVSAPPKPVMTSSPAPPMMRSAAVEPVAVSVVAAVSALPSICEPPVASEETIWMALLNAAAALLATVTVLMPVPFNTSLVRPLNGAKAASTTMMSPLMAEIPAAGAGMAMGV